MNKYTYYQTVLRFDDCGNMTSRDLPDGHRVVGVLACRQADREIRVLVEVPLRRDATEFRTTANFTGPYPER